MAAQTIGLFVVLLKMIWGSATSHHEGLSSVKNELRASIELQSVNIGNVTANISDRIHNIELEAMKTRAVTAETLQLYMRREDYNKATDEFKRDVRDAHDDLKQEMHAGFDRLQEQVSAVSMSIEENRKHRRVD